MKLQPTYHSRTSPVSRFSMVSSSLREQRSVRVPVSRTPSGAPEAHATAVRKAKMSRARASEKVRAMGLRPPKAVEAWASERLERDDARRAVGADAQGDRLLTSEDQQRSLIGEHR